MEELRRQESALLEARALGESAPGRFWFTLRSEAVGPGVGFLQDTAGATGSGLPASEDSRLLPWKGFPSPTSCGCPGSRDSEMCLGRLRGGLGEQKRASTPLLFSGNQEGIPRHTLAGPCPLPDHILLLLIHPTCLPPPKWSPLLRPPPRAPLQPLPV